MLKTKKIADMAIILAFAIIANIISFPTIPFLGRFSLVYTMAYVAGVFLGPIVGFCVTMLGDLIPALIFPQGAWMPLITIGTGLISLIVGLSNKYIRLNFQWRLIIGALIAYVVCTAIIIPLGEVPLFTVMKYTTAKLIGKSLGISSPFVLISLSKLITQPLWIAMNVVIVITVCVRLHKLIDNRYGNVIYKDFANKKLTEAATIQQ